VTGADGESPQKCTPSSCKYPCAVMLALKSSFAFFFKTTVVEDDLIVGGKSLSFKTFHWTSR
jgi:hypothetical protein